MRPVIAALILSFACIGFIAHNLLGMPSSNRPIPTKAEMLANAHLPPNQTETQRQPFMQDDFKITPKAEYDITALVFSTRRYHWNFIDRFHRISPEDFAVGWGAVIDLPPDAIDVRQEDRFFKWRVKQQLPLTREELISSMANNHIVPASDEIADRIRHVRAGDIVHMTGALVNIQETGYGEWATSLRRDDWGPGACEILWLENLDIVR